MDENVFSWPSADICRAGRRYEILVDPRRKFYRASPRSRLFKGGGAGNFMVHAGGPINLVEAVPGQL